MKRSVELHKTCYQLSAISATIMTI